MKILDLFCGAGGAATGLHRAMPDAEITGVDIAPQKHYPFRFIQADAMTFPLDGYDLIWASPPCQGYSIMRNLPWLKGKEYPMLIEPTRERLKATGTPYIIENVIGAPLQAGWLCGGMFGKPYYRHRLFETSFFWFIPGHPTHRVVLSPGRLLGSRARDIISRHDGMPRLNGVDNGRTAHQVKQAMECDWMTRDELSQAIPPAYSEYLGRQWRAQQP